MNETHVKQWTDALRSTNLPQAQGLLAAQRHNDTEMGYCCLGIACKKAGIEAVTHVEGCTCGLDECVGMFDQTVARFAGAGGVAPPELFEWLGFEWRGPELEDEADIRIDWPTHLSDPKGQFYHCDTSLACSGLNDLQHLSFTQIADLIDYFGITTPQHWDPQ